jgi:hypothetical protein
VSNQVSSVHSVRLPLVGALNRYQIERVPPAPAWSGSPACLVAPNVVVRTQPPRAPRPSEFAKWSFGGVGVGNQLSTTLPVAPPLPSTAIR